MVFDVARLGGRVCTSFRRGLAWRGVEGKTKERGEAGAREPCARNSIIRRATASASARVLEIRGPCLRRTL